MLKFSEFFYTSVIPFNVIRNPTYAKMCDMISRYGVGSKHPSYHDIREKLLKRALDKTDVCLLEYKEDGREKVTQLCLMRGQIRKGH